MINYGAVIPIFLPLFERTAFILSYNESRYLVTGHYHSHNNKYEANLYLDDKRVPVELNPVTDNAKIRSVSVFDCPAELVNFPALYSIRTNILFQDSKVNVNYGSPVTFAGHMSYSYFRLNRNGVSDHINVNRIDGFPSPYPMVRSGIISGMDSMADPEVFYMATGSQVSKYYAGGPVFNSSGLVIGVLGYYEVSTSKDPYWIDESDEDKFTLVHAMGPILRELDAL